jgi:hypothetical protein
MGRSSSKNGPADPSADAGTGFSMEVTKEVSHMMPMMSWMSFMWWFTLLIGLLFVAGVGALVALLLAQHGGPRR